MGMSQDYCFTPSPLSPNMAGPGPRIVFSGIMFDHLAVCLAGASDQFTSRSAVRPGLNFWRCRHSLNVWLASSTALMIHPHILAVFHFACGSKDLIVPEIPWTCRLSTWVHTSPPASWQEHHTLPHTTASSRRRRSKRPARHFQQWSWNPFCSFVACCCPQYQPKQPRVTQKADAVNPCSMLAG